MGGKLTLSVLGPISLARGLDKTPLRPREADVLAVLAAHHPQAVAQSEIAIGMWVSPPANDAKAIQNHVARLRRAAGPEVIETHQGTYRLGSHCQLDIETSSTAAAAAARALLSGDLRGRVLYLTDALSQVRGEPFADRESTPLFTRERLRWRETIAGWQDDLIGALLAIGDAGQAAELGRRLIDERPERERRWLLTACALHRRRLRRDALDLLRRCRATAIDAGIEPGPLLQQIETLILSDDPALHQDIEKLLYVRAPHVASKATNEFFVGREAELSTAASFLSARRDQHASGAIEVCGPRGIGRSAFVQRLALQARISGWEVIVLDPHADATSMVGAIRAAVEDTPALFVADDARFASSELSLASAPRSGATVVLSAGIATNDAPREESLIRRHANGLDVHLGGLSLAETVRALHLLTGTEPDFAGAVEIHRMTRGRPLRIREAAAELPSLDRTRRSAAAVVRDAAQLVVDRLEHDSGTVAALVACTQTPLSAAVIAHAAHILGVEQPFAALAEAIDRGACSESSNGPVPHGPVAARLAEGRPHADNDRLRWAIIVALRDAAMPVRLVAEQIEASHHWSFDDALVTFDRAADEALARSEYTEEIRWRGAAEELLAARFSRNHAETLRRANRRSNAMRHVGISGYAELQWSLAERCRRLGHWNVLLEVVANLCSAGENLQSGIANVSLDVLIDEALQHGTDPIARVIAAASATTFYSLSDARRCRAFVAMALDESAAIDDRNARMMAVETAYLGLPHPRDWQLRRALADEAITLSEIGNENIDRFEALHLMFSCQLQSADPMIRATMDRLSQLAGTVDSPIVRWMHDYLRTALLHLGGDFDGAETEALRIFQTSPVSESRAAATYFVQLFALRMSQGRAAELRPVLADLIVSQPAVPAWSALLAYTAALEGDLDPVVVVAEEIDCGRSLPADLGWVGAMYCLARAVALVGRADLARRTYDLVAADTAGWMAWIGHCAFGPFDLALAELAATFGEHDLADSHLVRANGLVRRLHAPAYQRDLALAAALLQRRRLAGGEREP